MRTHLEFVSDRFPPTEGEDDEINPGRYGKRLAEYIAAALKAHGFTVCAVDYEDWGVRIDIENAEFPLWIGCGNYEEFENGFLCFIEPSKPYVRRWLKKIPTQHTVERVASALEAILKESDGVSGFRWWSANEARP